VTAEIALDPTARPYRLVIADDHELARAGLRAMLSGELDLEIVGEATDGREALDLCCLLRPDLAILDVRMPEMDGLAATRAIKQTCLSTSVVIFTLHESPEYLLEALRAGAAGFLLKDASRRELIAAVRQVLAGDARPSVRSPSTPITPRELEVLRQVARGKTNREIGEQLSMSPGTAKVHVEHIISKLGVSDRTQAAVRALELGLLSEAT
jgi:DNA-binding NarL/FixJ family response regulator